MKFLCSVQALTSAQKTDNVLPMAMVGNRVFASLVGPAVNVKWT